MAATGHVTAAVSVHMFCNAMGFPAFHDVSKHRHSRAITLAYVIGIAGFAVLFPWVQTTSMYRNGGPTHHSSRYVVAILSVKASAKTPDWGLHLT